MNYVEKESIMGILQNNQYWKAFQQEYSQNYDNLEKMLGETFSVVDSLINNLRAMYNLESELFYRIGIRDGVSITHGDMILDNLGGV